MAKKKRPTKKATPKKKQKAPTSETVLDTLNAQQELFCRYYTQNRELFGNGTLSYAEAYGYKLEDLSEEPTKVKVGKSKRTKKGPSERQKAENVCAVESSRFLRTPKIQARITVLLNELLKDEVVDSELARLIQQDGDLPTKIKSIAEYNKLRGRIIDKTKVITERFAMDDIRALLAPLPKERQDEIYATLTAAIAEAEELLRRSSQV